MKTKNFLFVIAIIFILIFSTFTFLFRTSEVSGSSMEPNLESGDINIYFKTRNINRFDIISIFPPDKKYPNPFVKRVIAFPRETIEVRNGNIYINNKIVDSPFRAKRDDIIDIKPIEVPNGKIFVLGDNRLISLDSEELGCFNISDINGKLIYVLNKNLLSFYGLIIKLILYII